MCKKTFEPEQQFVIDTFQKSFESIKKQNIVLYGVGKNTEAVLYGTDGFSFAGLMDQAMVGQTIFEHQVLSEEEVIFLHPVIVIIARESVVNIIFKRIQHLQTEHGIEIYDFQGKLLGQENLVYSNQNLPYWDASEQELWEQIAKHDVISFDIFDTLLMRRVLQPEDAFLLAELQLKAEGLDYPFAKMRKEAEVTLTGYPDLEEIYENLQALSGWTDVVINRMKKVECETDASLLLRREVMCQIFQMAVEQGKKVYLISDMYYPKEYLEELLSQNRIVGYQELFVSCDVKKEKSDGSLFQWYLEQVKDGSKLHIGDNRRSDVQKALENGIDAYQVYSAYELLMASSMQEILSDVQTLQQRCMLGLVIAKMFQDPFTLHTSKGYVTISDVQAVGYCFVAPMMTAFMKWFLEQIRKQQVEQILFPSRDGYFIQKLYRLMAQEEAESVYFRTSRRAVSVAGIRDWSDIERIASRKYHGTYAQYFQSRFGITMKEEDVRKDQWMKDVADVEIMAVVREYEDAIMQSAEIERKCYLEYLNRQGVLTEKKQVLFDFVASGTVQYNLTRILQKDIPGLYFATMNLPNVMYEADTAQIATAYGNIQSYGTQNQLGKYYLFLETILIDDKESFSHIGENGEEIFDAGSAKSSYAEIENLQTAVLAYAGDYKKYFANMDDTSFELTFADKLFGMLFSKQCVVEKSVKDIFQNDDVYDGIGCYQLWNE